MIDLVRRMDFFAAMVRTDGFTRAGLTVAFMLLYRHFNGRTGRCDPSISTLAEETGLTRRSVNSAIEELRKSGWWRIEQGGGRGYTNSYFPQVETVNSASSIEPGNSETRFTVSASQRVKHSVKKGEARFTRTSKNQKSDSHTIDVVARSARARDGRVEYKDSDFERFWQIYPHRGSFSDPRKPAWLRFEAAIKRGVDPAAIIAGAKRFRAHVEQQGTEPRFRPQAKTWLNEERWAQLHEPEPVRLRVGMN
jgi:biotin operon repressor